MNLECWVRHEVVLGSHELFVGEILAVHADEGVFTPDGRVDARVAGPVVYLGDGYYGLGAWLEHQGFSRSGTRNR